jgi:hypothetical protein
MCFYNEWMEFCLKDPSEIWECPPWYRIKVLIDFGDSGSTNFQTRPNESQNMSSKISISTDALSWINKNKCVEGLISQPVTANIWNNYVQVKF